MIKAMDNQPNISSPAVLGVTLMMNLIAILDRGTVTFVLGVMVSILAGIHYVLQIRKLSKEEKANKKESQPPPSLN